MPPTHTNDGPRYVVRIEPDSNVVVIGREDELGADGLVADDVNVIRPERFGADATPVLAMTRYRAPLARARPRSMGDRLRLRFDAPERAVTPGQLVALYDEAGEVLAGATILSAS